MAVRALVGIVLALLLVYGCVKAIPLLRGPYIRLETPVAFELLPDRFMTISGVAVHTRSLALNGAPFLIDEQGRFSETLLLPPGGAILTLTATDRFGRTAQIRRSVFVP